MAEEKKASPPVPTPEQMDTILTGLGEAFEKAPARVKGAVLALTAEDPHQLDFSVFIGGGPPPYFRPEVRSHAKHVVSDWLDKIFDRKREAPEEVPDAPS